MEPSGVELVAEAVGGVCGAIVGVLALVWEDSRYEPLHVRGRVVEAFAQDPSEERQAVREDINRAHQRNHMARRSRSWFRDTLSQSGTAWRLPSMRAIHRE